MVDDTHIVQAMLDAQSAAEANYDNEHPDWGVTVDDEWDAHVHVRMLAGMGSALDAAKKHLQGQPKTDWKPFYEGEVDHLKDGKPFVLVVVNEHGREDYNVVAWSDLACDFVDDHHRRARPIPKGVAHASMIFYAQRVMDTAAISDRLKGETLEARDG